MFMPRQKINWDPVEKRGNPTRSEEVNSLINRVRKAEVRKHGAPSKKTRPVELEEFLNVLKLNKSNEKRKGLGLLYDGVHVRHVGVLYDRFDHMQITKSRTK